MNATFKKFFWAALGILAALFLLSVVANLLTHTLPYRYDRWDRVPSRNPTYYGPYLIIHTDGSSHILEDRSGRRYSRYIPGSVPYVGYEYYIVSGGDGLRFVPCTYR